MEELKTDYGETKHFTHIEAWKIDRQIRRKIYGIIRILPDERNIVYSLRSQMGRTATSITAIIAEGYGRFHFQENVQFCRQSRSSVYEIQDHLITCLDEGYINEGPLQEVYNLTNSCIKVTNGYIRMLNKQKDQGQEAR